MPAHKYQFKCPGNVFYFFTNRCQEESHLVVNILVLPENTDKKTFSKNKT